MKKEPNKEKKCQEKVEKALDSVFDEPFGKKREKADKKKGVVMKKTGGDVFKIYRRSKTNTAK